MSEPRDHQASIERVWFGVEARMREDADAAISSMIDARARRYAREPWRLESLQAGLSTAAPKALIARVDALLEQADQGELPRWFGMGGENVTISLRAARRLGEMLLAAEAA